MQERLTQALELESRSLAARDRIEAEAAQLKAAAEAEAQMVLGRAQALAKVEARAAKRAAESTGPGAAARAAEKEAADAKLRSESAAAARRAAEAEGLPLVPSARSETGFLHVRKKAGRYHASAPTSETVGRSSKSSVSITSRASKQRERREICRARSFRRQRGGPCGH